MSMNLIINMEECYKVLMIVIVIVIQIVVLHHPIVMKVVADIRKLIQLQKLLHT